MSIKRIWDITVLGDRSETADVVRRERFHGTEDEAVERACIVMGSELRVDVTPV